MTTIYIAGPMTGLPAFNYPAFNEAETWLTDAGHRVLNPVRADEVSNKPEAPTWEWYMRHALDMVLAADGIAVLPGWECSRGARLEVDVAHALRLPVLPIAQWCKADPA